MAFAKSCLGMLLGLLFYYTNNLAYNIFIHFINNATVVSFMFFNARQKNQSR
jgi:membrane protease YdiL (CAAX protease family)